MRDLWLGLPPEVIEAGAEAISGGSRGMVASRDRSRRVLESGGRLLLAEALEELADELPGSHRRGEYAAARQDAATFLRNTAAELRGPRLRS